MLFLGFRNDLVFTEEFTCDAGMDIVDDRGLLGPFDDVILAGASRKEIQSLIGRARRVSRGL